MIKTKDAMLPLSALVCLLIAGSDALAGSESKGRASMTLQLTSPAFRNGERIPQEFTADGKNQSPPLKWANVPEGTKSLALICDDPDAPMGTWVHWVLYDMTVGLNDLEQGIPPMRLVLNGAKQGLNSFRKIGYGGPSPPPGKAHRYFFKLFALDTNLNVQPDVDAKKLEAAISGHILGEAQLIGLYSR
jgi:Raf kinase inhibitor-like YbhB/YbcL family protein